MTSTPPIRDLTRTTLAVLVLILLIGASFWVLQPFLPALIWATMIVVATWSLLLRVQGLLGGRRGPAVVVMTLAMFVVFAVPVLLVITTLAGKAPDLLAMSQSLTGFTIPSPPQWVPDLPVVGRSIARRWTHLASLSRGDLAEQLTPYVKPAIHWFVARLGGLGSAVVHLLLTGLLAAFLYARGERVASGLRAFARRLAGANGDRAVDLAGGAIRGVALGVVGTALVQSALAGVGLAVVGIPYAGLLTALIFLFCVAQIGPLLVLLAAIAWLYWSGSSGLATVLLVWSLPVVTLDNFLRPLLIRRGLDLPLLLIFAGVLGGILAFGIIGIFIGPMLLAVTFTLLVNWIQEPAQEEAPASEEARIPSAL